MLAGYYTFKTMYVSGQQYHSLPVVLQNFRCFKRTNIYFPLRSPGINKVLLSRTNPLNLYFSKVFLLLLNRLLIFFRHLTFALFLVSLIFNEIEYLTGLQLVFAFLVELILIQNSMNYVFRKVS